MPAKQPKSNTTPTEFKRWDQYTQEASKPPFLLPVSDDRTIVIEAPTGEQVARAQELAQNGGTVEEQLRMVCGDAADDILPLVMAAPAGAMNALVMDIMRHFDLDAGGKASPRT